MKKCNRILSLTLALAMVISMCPGLSLTAFADEITTLSGGETLIAGGTYQLAEGATGTITVSTTDTVTIIGNGAEWDQDTTSATHGAISSTANQDLSIVGSVAGIDLTLKDMYLNNSGVAAVDVTGTGNVLTFDGTVILDQSNAPNVHVGPEAGITIKGTTGSRAYLYKTSQTAGIGGNSGEACGEIVFGVQGGANDFYVFMKGSRQGAVIGSGANCSAVPGNITFNSGIYNLLGIARGAIISGSAGADSQGAGNTIVNGGLINLNVDFSGAAIGGGGYAEGNDKSGGLLYVSGGSIRTYIDSNAVSSWSSYGVTEAGVNDAAITAGRVNGEGEDVYLLVVDTADVAADSYTIKVDGTTYYVGSRYAYAYYKEDVNRDTDGDGQADIATAPLGTPGNWAPMTESCFYLYVTGADHTVTVNGVDTDYAWDAETSAFSVVEPVTYAWYEAGTETGSYTISTADELKQLAAIVNGTDENYAQDNFVGKTVALANDIALAEDDLYTAIENVTYGSSSWPMKTTQYVISQEAPVWTPIGSGSASGNTVSSTANAFAGTFDGKGHTVSGIYTGTTSAATANTATVQGLFGIVTGTVKNVTVSGCVTGNSVVGGVVAYLNGGSVENCVNNAIVFSDGGTTPNANSENGTERAGATGGIVGLAAGTGSVTGCVNNATVICTNTAKGGRVGGIVGLIDQSGDAISISKCVNNGNVAGYQYVAGICGMNYAANSPIDRCVNNGDITFAAGGKSHAGGIAGQFDCQITNCINTGNIHSTHTTSQNPRYFGGIAGDYDYKAAHGDIINCYTIGTITYDYSTAADVGIIVGESGYTTNSYFLDTAKANSGSAVAQFQGISKTDAELKEASMAELLGEAYQTSCGYPVLDWQTPVPHSYADGVCTGCGAADPNCYVWYEAANADGVYEIDSAEELAQLAAIVNGTDANYDKDTFVGKTVKLTADIDLAAVCSAELGTWNSIGGAAENVTLTITSQEDLDAMLLQYNILYDNTGWSYKYGTDKNLAYDENKTYYAVVGQIFSGTFDGNGKTISNLYVLADAGYAGLFGNVDGTLKNFTVKGSVTTATGSTEVDFVGGVTGKLSEGGRIERVTSYVDVDATAKAYNVGGIAGFNGTKNATADNQFSSANNTFIIECVNYGNVYGWSQVGGIAGENAGQILRCANYGDVDALKSGSKAGIGGIAGRNGCNNQAYTSGTITDCYNFGTIADNENKWVGGIAGFNNAASSVTNCYNVGMVYGAGQANAIVGQNEASGSCTVSNCWYLESTKVFDESGVYGGNFSNCGPKAEAEMKDSAFAAILGENFNVDSDSINEGYPVLDWMGGTAAPSIYTVTIPTSGTGYTVAIADGSATSVVEGGSFSFSVYLLDGFKITGVVAGETALTAEAGVYTVENINADVTITITVEEIVELYGDLNGDNKINAKDATLILRYAAQLIGEDEINLTLADVNADGSINAKDATLILRYAAQLITEFPVASAESNG